MTIAFHLFSGLVLSFIGSLPLGMINLTVSETTIQRGMRAGLVVAIGAAFVELVQAFVSVRFASWLMGNERFDQYIQWGAVVIFLVLGIYFFRKQSGEASVEIGGEERGARWGDGVKGVVVSALNVLAIPYWLFYGTYLSAEGWLQTNWDIFVFSVGVMLGTFLLLWCYAYGSRRLARRVRKLAQRADRYIGIIFLILALIQFIRLLAKNS